MEDANSQSILDEMNSIFKQFKERSTTTNVALDAMSNIIVAMFKDYGNLEKFQSWIADMVLAYEKIASAIEEGK